MKQLGWKMRRNLSEHFLSSHPGSNFDSSKLASKLTNYSLNLAQMMPQRNFIPHNAPAEAAGGAGKAALTTKLGQLSAFFFCIFLN